MNEKICFYWPPFSSVKSYYDMIDVSEKYGMKAIEGFSMLDFATPDIDAAKRVREYADSKNIKFVCFSVYINLVGQDSEEMMKKLKAYADVAKILGSPYLHHTIANDFCNPVKIIPYKAEFFKKGISAVREIYDYAENIGLRTIYEEQGYVFNGIGGFGEFLNTVDRNVGVVGDFANICQAGDSPVEFIKSFSDRIVHAHIKDVTLTDTDQSGEGMKTLTDQYMNEAIIGDGIIEIQTAIEVLKKSGYTGYYGIEYTSRDNDVSVIDKSLRLIDSML